jgi:VanZ family protein
MAALFLASAQTDPPDPPGGVSDKVVHALAYALLGALVLIGLGGARARAMTRAAALRAVLLASAYGVTDEVHQIFVAGRSASPADWLADALGAVVGACLLQIIAERLAGSVPTRDV